MTGCERFFHEARSSTATLSRKSHPNILMHFIFASKMTKNTISARVSLPLFSLCVNRCVVLPIDTSGICCAP
ncbi:hypothetical protein Ae717Ps2_6427c [Pseudonocardia sp. Ae717_Ps2]|nr:hypothetical protein Ae717Ps2_6383c [Pseudonocardia sp. Ae717_Ps2]OLM28508.1 hypothetical protein Ae717Ps2_6404c [Pseudonocardia sp. Ae717_Ps2]OLM28531.1 hypothetical protein Ae717Ps2_6427c [Pseudonocardia sp. Ae717_Ps2]